jgi:hypothetical protein
MYAGGVYSDASIQSFLLTVCRIVGTMRAECPIDLVKKCIAASDNALVRCWLLCTRLMPAAGEGQFSSEVRDGPRCQVLAEATQKRADAALASEVDLSDRPVFNDRPFGNTKGTPESTQIPSFCTVSAAHCRVAGGGADHFEWALSSIPRGRVPGFGWRISSIERPLPRQLSHLSFSVQLSSAARARAAR